jgi:hypothetical protein
VLDKNAPEAVVPRMQIDALDGVRGFGLAAVVATHLSNSSPDFINFWHVIPGFPMFSRGKAGRFLVPSILCLRE